MTRNARKPGTLGRVRFHRARVSGVNGGDGNYRLFNRVSNSGGQCALDIAEEFGRNDRGSSATVLTAQADAPGHYQFNEGYICDLMRSDEDWYRFNVPENRSSICVLAQGFIYTEQM